MTGVIIVLCFYYSSPGRYILNNVVNMVSTCTNPYVTSCVQVRFAQEASLDPAALVSFPGSGNTWLR